MWPLVGKDTIWIEVAGNTCTPWSHYGSMKGWLDEASLPALAWGYWLSRTLPTFIVNECTPAWPSQSFFAGIMPQQYRVMTRNVSPTDLGIPSRRPRLYSAACLCSSTCELAPLDELFMPALRRSVQMDAGIFFRAPPQVQQDFVKVLLKSHGMVVAGGAELKLQGFSALTFSNRQRLSGYKVLYGQACESGQGDGYLCDISQNSYFVRHLHSVMPTLIKASMIYNMKVQRLLCRSEHFVSMECLSSATNCRMS